MYCFKKLQTVAIILFMVSSYAISAAQEKLERTRVAIFDEAGFPNKSEHSIDWFKQAAEAAGGNVNILSLKEIQAKNCFSREKYDTIIFPHGGYVPLDAEEALGRFMGQGGSIIIAGDMFGRLPYPESVEIERRKLLKEVQARQDFKNEEYNNFLMKNGLTESCFLRDNPDLKRWIVPVAYLYYHGCNTKKIMDEFGLYGWPNHCSFANPRPFKDVLTINPELEKLLPGFPVQIVPPADLSKRVGGNGLIRVNLPTKAILGTGGEGAFSFNKLISLYKFEKPSLNEYPSFKDAGKKEEDRNTDFFIYRYHDYLHEGATLIVLGKTGSVLLGSKDGMQIFGGLLKLAESKLPEEYTAEYYRKSHLADKLISDLQGVNLRLCSELAKYAKFSFFKNDLKSYADTEKLLDIQKKIFTESDLKYFTITQHRVKGMKTDDAQMEEFLNFCHSELDKADALNRQYSEKLKELLTTPAQKEVKHPFKKLAWGMLTLGPLATYEKENTLRRLDEIGIRDAPVYSYDWEQTSCLYEKTGIFSGYHFFYHEIYCQGMDKFKMGILNPKTGQITYKEKQWFKDAAAWEKYENIASWFLTKAQNQKGIGSIIYGEERDLEWSFWGDYMRQRFVKYLIGKYSSIDELNKKWDSSYGSFSEIKLPLKQPESQTEHALWEDWTRYREIYRLQEEVIPLVNIVKKYAPRLIQWYYGSYYMQRIHPANGINYYEVGKLFDPASMEGTFRTGEEVLNADICGFQKKVIIPEWGTFYFSPNGARAQVDLLKAAAWNSVNWGMIGCHTFMGWESNPNFIGSGGLLTHLGSQMKELTADLKYLQHIYLDGAREEVPVRILYSPTTRRHTSWPDIEGDKSLDEVCGYYEALRSLHCQARAIDEMAVMEGKLPKETKVLIVPQVTYMNSILSRKLDEFVKSGGTLIATSDSGRFDEYGQRQDYLLAKSGISCVPAKSKRSEGVDFNTFSKDVFVLNAVFPENSKTVLHYEDGAPAGVISPAGKGKLFILGIPFGREYSSNLKKAPRQALALLKKILDTIGLDQDYICSDTHLVIRPWIYDGDKYLMLNYLHRDEMMVQKQAKGFPLKRSPGLIPFELSIRGAVDVEDYLLGKKLETTFDGTFTTVKGIIENPGGAAYRLIPVSDKNISVNPENKEVIAVTDSQDAGTASQGIKSYPLPFEGRLFWEDGKVKVGDYLFSSEIVTEGQWAGKFYVIIEHGGKIVKKECKKGETVKFWFAATTLIVECEEVISVMPGNIKCRISETRNAPVQSSGCRIREEKFHGQDSIIMENGYLFARIIPSLGGRIIEFKSREDSPNNMFCNRKAIIEGLGNLWLNYGGMEENAGAYPGPCWNISYKYKIMENTDGKIVLKLEKSNPIKWQMSYGIKKGGTNSFEKIFTLDAKASFLSVKIRQYNETSEDDMLTLRTHPVFNIAGDVNSADTLYFPESSGHIIKIPYRTGTNTHFQNNGDWCAFLDNEKRTGIIQTFEKNAVSELYTWMGDDGYNVELVYNLVNAPGGKSVDFDYNLGLVSGLSGISGFGDNMVVNIIAKGSGIYGRQENVQFTVEVATLEKIGIKIQSVMKNKKGDVVETFKQQEAAISPGMPISVPVEWNTGDLPDGVYEIVASISVAGRNDFKVSAEIELAGKSIVDLRKKIEYYRKRLNEMKKQYKNIENDTLRNKIVKGSIILNELEEAVNSNNKSKIENSTAMLNNIIK